MKFRKVADRAALVRNEALAYLRLGLMTPVQHRVKTKQSGPIRVGVLFVPGLGANGGNFMSMRDALRDHVDQFDVFDYFSLQDPRKLARHLRLRIRTLAARCRALFCIGHSLGGVLIRMALQDAEIPSSVAGFAAICSPLHGTWRSRWAPGPLRQLTPDSAMMDQLLASADRLKPLRNRILTVSARHDQFVSPASSALLDLGPQLMLEDVAHNGALLDSRVHSAVLDLIRQGPRDDRSVSAS
ncbi:MAG: alpha/beta fold hydrolase [Myxococcota bacterium]